MPDILTGPAAIQHLVTEHPGAHAFFGAHASDMHFAARLSLPDFLVMECAGCWLFVRAVDDHTGECHWFCPRGVNLPALRAMLAEAFVDMGVDRLVGETPEGHVNERAARVVNRALGAEKENGVYTLTRERLLAYTPHKINP